MLIEKVTFQTPFAHEVVFQNEGCLLYFKHVELKFRSAEDRMHLTPKEALLLRCGTYFFDLLKTIDSDTVEVIAVHFYPDMLKEMYIKDLPELIERQNFQKPSERIAPDNVVTRFVESLDFYFEYPSLVNDELLELKIKELILLLVQTHKVNSILELITDLYSSRNVNLKRVIELHLYSDLRIEQFAKLCHLSVSTFTREFKKEFNDSPRNYLLTKKLEKAKELLRITDLQVNEIAYQIGFNDPLYFTRVFKQRVGASPTAFRANFQH